MNYKNWKQLAFLGCIIGSVSYIVLTSIAMFFYGGGTEVNPGTTGFSLFENYFGDLIIAIAHNGSDNTISSILSKTGSILFGILLIPAGIASYQFFSKKSQKISAGLGIFFQIFLGVDFTLLILFYYQFLLAFLIYFLLLLSWVFYLIAFFLNKDLPRKWTYLLLIAIIVFVISVPFFFHSDHVLVATSQKIIWYTLLAYYIMISVCMIKQSKTS